MEIKSVAIIGLGAVGSYFYEGLERIKDSVTTTVIASGTRKERLEKDGITINGVHYSPHTEEYIKDVNLLLVATKNGDIENILPSIRMCTGENTIVISLLNGVESEEKISSVIDEKNILYSMMQISSHRNGSSINFDPEAAGGVFIGEKNGGISERMRDVKALFDKAGLKCTLSENILCDQWYKFASNCSGNLPQAVLGIGAGCYSLSRHVDFIAEKLWDEVASIAGKKNISLGEYPFKGKKRAKRAATRWSTLQDLDNKRHTEIDAFSGYVVKKGEELGIETPYNSCIYHLIKALEEKNDGLFDFEV